jgi:uncharacterized protein
MATAAQPPLQLPVTMAAVRSARPGEQTALEAWGHSLCAIARRFPGYLHSWVKNVDPNAARVSIGVTFATASDLARWQASPERRHHLREGDRLTDGPPLPIPAGAEPGHSQSSTGPAQPRWLLALLVWLGLYPPAVLVNCCLSWMLAAWPVALSTFVTTAALVLFVVFVSLPLLQRVAKHVTGWLGA